MPWVGFETTISAGERPKTYALDRAATGTGNYLISYDYKSYILPVAPSNNSPLVYFRFLIPVVSYVNEGVLVRRNTTV